MWRQTTITATHFGVSFTYRHSDEETVLGIYRHHDYNPRTGERYVRGFARFLSQRGDLDGTIYPNYEAACEAALEHGYIKYDRTGRNSTSFVMSRAARKRGYTTDNIFYKMGIEKGEKIKSGELI